MARARVVMEPAAWCVLGTAGADRSAAAPGEAEHGPVVELVDLDRTGRELRRERLSVALLPQRIAGREAQDAPRWAWSDTARWSPPLLEAGVRVRRAHDLRLVHALLASTARIPATDRAALLEERDWAVAPELQDQPPPRAEALFDLGAAGPSGPRGVPADAGSALAELRLQLAAISAADAPAALVLLAAAESAGALIAAELHAAGVPWDVAEHDRVLTEELGPRPRTGVPPQRMVETAAEVRRALGDPQLAIDSPPQVLRALRRAELPVSSTSKWELAQHDHPAIPPLLRYKQMSRLLTANGWAWIDAWVQDGRYRPVYVPAGVVTGRWASSGGGALQIPRRLRGALRADPGWMLVSADVAQLEPRVLAAMSGDAAMARAGAGTDLYAGIVEAGVVATRQEAKIGVLGALYGGTSGDSGRVVPRLRETFPRAMEMVDEAARTGERGGVVRTWLGRTSPEPSPEWAQDQRRAHLPDAAPAEGESARRAARDRGRFTRNFIVQGTAAEWALCWMALLRQKLDALGEVEEHAAALASGLALARRPHLAYFLHDEVIVHAPASLAEEAAAAVRAAAEEAGRLLFPGSPVDFPLEMQIAERSAEK